jgi:hypothetical protein
MTILVQADWVEQDAYGKWKMNKPFVIELDQYAPSPINAF